MLILTVDDDGKSKGVAFAVFPDASTAKKATTLNGTKLKYRTLRINMANEKPN